jgi:hypothetical protein
MSFVEVHCTIDQELREHPVPKVILPWSAAGCSENEREWYTILALWSPLQLIRLLEDSTERADRLRQNSPFVSLLPDLGSK